MERPIVEQNELLNGEYSIKVEFKNFRGESLPMDLSLPIELKKGETLDELKRKALSVAQSVGLHNFGMDVYVGRFPDGHPVKFTLKHESGKEIEFTQLFDGAGYALK